MIKSTSGILLKRIKHSDSGAVLNVFTREFGKKAYYVRGLSKKRNSPRSILFPLAILELQVTERDNKSLQQIREVSLSEPTPQLISDPIKASICLFINEILHKSIEDDYTNDLLYDFLQNSIQILDLTDDPQNFHVWFLVELSKYFGFYPQNTSVATLNQLSYFNLETGSFTISIPSVHKYLDTQESLVLQRILGMKFDEVKTLKIKPEHKKRILHGLVDFYIHHVPGLNHISSLDVLETVFEF